MPRSGTGNVAQTVFYCCDDKHSVITDGKWQCTIKIGWLSVSDYQGST